MKPLTKQICYLPSKVETEEEWFIDTKVSGYTYLSKENGYFFTSEQMEEFIGEVFDEGKSTENLDNRTSGGYSHGRDIKQELIKQLLQ